MTEKVTITEIIKKDGKNRVPILVNFQNGSLNEFYASKGKFIVAENKTTKKNEGIFSINNNIYTGQIRENKDSPVNNYIAIKRGNKIRLVEIDECTLTHKVHSRQTDSIDRFSNKELALKVLMKNFGGKKSKAYYEKTERSKVNIDVIKTQLNKTLTDTIIEEESEKISEIDIVPPFNENAKKPMDVYNLTDILPQEVLDSLKEEATEVEKFDTERLPIPSEFLKKEITRVKLLKDQNQRFLHLKVLIYMDGLLNYTKLNKRNVDGGVELSKISDKITDDICKRFSPKDSVKLMRTATSIDKAIIYFAVLAILIQPNFELDINILTTEIGRPKRKVLQSCNMAHIKLIRFTDNLSFTIPSKTKAIKRRFNRKTI